MTFPQLSFQRKIWLLILLGFLAFFNSLSYPFVHDDFVLLLGRPGLSLENLGEVFLQTAQHGDARIANAYYRPVLEVFSRLEYLVFGPHPAGYHGLNILLHIGNGLLIFLFLKRLFQKEFLAFAAALFFLIHPVQSEAVASIAGLSNILMLFFGFLSLLFYLKAREGRTGFYILSALMYVLAVLVKEQVIVLPFLVLATEIFFPRDGRRRPGRFFYYAVPAVLYLLWRKWIAGGFLAGIFQYPQELWLRLVHIPTALITYFKILLFPWGLHYYRSVDILTPAAGAWIMLPAAAVLYVWCVYKSPAEDRPYHLWGSLWFVTALLPVLNILPLIHEYSLIAAFEHFLYFPVIGFLVTAAVFFRRFLLRFGDELQGKLLQSGIGLLVVSSLFLTLYQNHFWSSETALFERTVRYQPEFGRVHLLLGTAYLKEDRLSEAAAAFQKGLDIMRVYEKKAEGTPAREVYSRYILEARLSLNHIGVKHLRRHRMNEAAGYFQRILERDPGNVFALSNLAVCYIEKKEWGKARAALKEALRIAPGFTAAEKNLEKLEQQLKDNKE